MTIDLSTIFSALPQTVATSPVFNKGYVNSNLDILFQKMGRVQAIKQNKLLDFMSLETDRNVMRESIAPSLEKIIGQLSIATQASTMITNQIFAAGILEYFPSNIRNVIGNFQGLMDTNVNMLSSIASQQSFKQVGLAFATDLITEYTAGNVSFNNLLLMSQKIADYASGDQNLDANNAIRAVLSLDIQDFLPFDTTEIFQGLEYLDLVSDIFDDDSATAFTGILSQFHTDYSAQKVSDVMEADYSTQKVSLDDPIGLVAKSSVVSDFISTYTTQLNATLTANSTTYPLTTEQRQQIIDVLVEDITNNLDAAFQGTIGLPSLLSVSRSIVADTQNKTWAQIKIGINSVIVKIIQDLGINATPSGTNPADYLHNLKKNIAARKKMLQAGVTGTGLDAMSSYLKTIFPSGKFTETDLNNLSDRLQELLKETLND